MTRLFPMMALLALLAISPMAPAVQVSPMEGNLVAVESSARGEERDQVLSDLKDEAVLATTGRIFLGDSLVRAEELLHAYLQNYGQQFVKGVEVLEDRFSGGQTELRTRVYVDYEALHADLAEKRFIFTPAFSPFFTVFLYEEIDGSESPEPESRRTVQEVMMRNGFKPSDLAIEEISRGIDVRDDAEDLHAAFVAAERRGIEILMVGRAATDLREQRDVYYDRFFFYDTELELSMYRVDTRELLARASTKGSASDRARGIAVTTAIERAAQQAASRFASTYSDYWPTVVQSEADFQLLLTGADDDSIRIVSQHLDRLGPGTRVHVKRRLGPSALLTIESGADRERFVELLGELTFPALRVVEEHTGNRFEVQITS